jgi:hypothetical protein
VDKINRVQLVRYPHRFLLEFEIPEPGVWLRWLHQGDNDRELVHQPPIPLTVNGQPEDPSNNPRLTAADIIQADLLNKPDNPGYLVIAARYATPGIAPPPGNRVITVAMARQPDATAVIRFQNDNKTAVLPAGYLAKGWRAAVSSWHNENENPGGKYVTNHGDIWISLGAGQSETMESVDQAPTWGEIIGQIKLGKVGPIDTGNVPVSIMGNALYGYVVGIEIDVEPLPETVSQWQNETYDQITAAYFALKQQSDDEKASRPTQLVNLVDAASPAENKEIVTREIKRQVVEMLTGTRFKGRSAIKWDPPYQTAPCTDLPKAAQFAPEIQFLEQSFEWENMTYVLYPYYWADQGRWGDLARIAGNDEDFARFLSAGSARVIVPARPGFEDQVSFYTEFGVIWGGGPVPAPNDPDYLSVAQEIKAQQQRPRDGTPVNAWEVRIPTALIWLENPVGLPANLKPTILLDPYVFSVSPVSGAVGTSVTITGTNLGLKQGSSVVAFNGTVATSTSWSPTLIKTSVPKGATSGEVVVTVNGVAASGGQFTIK